MHFKYRNGFTTLLRASNYKLYIIYIYMYVGICVCEKLVRFMYLCGHLSTIWHRKLLRQIGGKTPIFICAVISNYGGLIAGWN